MNLKIQDAPLEVTFNATHPNGLITNTPKNIKSSHGLWYGYILTNQDATAAYVQVFYATSDSVVPGTTSPDLIILIPGSGSVAWDFSIPKGGSSTGFSCIATTTPTGSTATTTGITGTFLYV